MHPKTFQTAIQKSLEKNLEIDGKQAPKREPKGATKTPQKPSKNKPDKNIDKWWFPGILTDKTRVAPFLCVYCFRWLSVVSRIFLSRPTVSRGFP